MGEDSGGIRVMPGPKSIGNRVIGNREIEKTREATFAMIQ